MAELTVQQIVIGGLEFTTAAATDGTDEFDNDGSTFLYVDNQNAADCEVTIAQQTACPVPGATVGDHDVVVDVTAGETRMIGPFAKKYFDDVDEHVNVTYELSPPTSVSVAAIKM
jgi:hypothetical protein